MAETIGDDQTRVELFAARHLRRNFTALTADMGLFGAAWAFASVSTILPAFAQGLGASNLIIGAIPSAMTLGYMLPPLFAANYTERLARKLPFVLTYTSWERFPFLVLAAAAFWLAPRSPSLTLALVLVCLLVAAGSGGFLTPAWMDFIGTTIPARWRGRLMASGSVVGSGLGLAGAVLAGYYLRRFPFPTSYAVCFLTGFVLVMLSWGALALAKEPEGQSGRPHVGMLTYMRGLPGILRRDSAFAWFLGARAIAAFGGMANAFFTVYALRRLGAAEGMVASYTLVLLGSQTLANLFLGSLADRLGHKPVLALGFGAAALANVVALMATTPAHLYAVFACMALSFSAHNVSNLNIVVEFAPPEARPTYIGLASTMIAPLSVGAPLIGGSIADSAGYPAVFALSMVAAALGAVVLLARVRDPRERAVVESANTAAGEG